jgi:hypothetical protein
MFGAIKQEHGKLTLDAPIIVHAFTNGVTGGSDYWTNDHWVVSVRYPSGKEEGIFDYVYDRAHQRIRFASYIELGQSDTRYGRVFPYSPADHARGVLQQERGLGVKAGTTPQLVFYAVDPQYLNPATAKTHGWSAGGENPTNPVWHIVGVDGQHYFIGNDGHVHGKADIPFAH